LIGEEFQLSLGEEFVKEEISLLNNPVYRELIVPLDIVKFLDSKLGADFIKYNECLKRENQFIMLNKLKEEKIFNL